MTQLVTAIVGLFSSVAQAVAPPRSELLLRFKALDRKERSGEVLNPDYMAVLNGFIDEGGAFNPLAVDQYGWTEAMEISSCCGYEGLKVAVEHGLRFNPEAMALGYRTEAHCLGRSVSGDYNLRLYADNIMEGYERDVYNTKICDDRGRNLVMLIAEDAFEGVDVLQAYLETGGLFDPAVRDNHGRSEAFYIAEYVHMNSWHDSKDMVSNFPRAISSEFYHGPFRSSYDFEHAEGFRVFLEHGGRLDRDDKQEAAYFMNHKNKVVQALYQRWFSTNALDLPLPESLVDAPSMGFGTA